MRMPLRCSFLLITLIATFNAQSAPEIRAIRDEGTWNLSTYLSLAAQDPSRVMSMVEEQLQPAARKRARTSPDMAFAWQERVALIGALTEVFNPETKVRGSAAEIQKFRVQARNLLTRVLLEDPALLVRDGAVEAIRRVNRMRPRDARTWKTTLEKAFMDRQNILEGEGLFIRETILTAIREASIPLGNEMRKAAELDQNPKVRGLLSLWSTRTFDSL